MDDARWSNVFDEGGLRDRHCTECYQDHEMRRPNEIGLKYHDIGIWNCDSLCIEEMSLVGGFLVRIEGFSVLDLECRTG